MGSNCREAITVSIAGRKEVEVMYRVTIVKIDENVPDREREYKKIADTGNESDDGPVYGYVYADGTKTVETEIFKQRDEERDLAAVIKAVNKKPARVNAPL